MSERFYLNWPLQPGPVELTGPEAHHLVTVCRLRPGDAVTLFNGDGHEYPALVAETDRRRVALDIQERRTPLRELPFTLEVAAPLPKGDRAQFLVEKLTELGVTSFVPLITKRSVVQPREAKQEKLRRYVVEASKQCGRNVLMEVQAVVAWEAYCRREEIGRQRLLGHPGGTARLRDLPIGPAGESLAWAVGPEGGFTDDEIALAAAAGWQTLDLGPRILRLETAALVVPALVGFPQPATFRE